MAFLLFKEKAFQTISTLRDYEWH